MSTWLMKPNLILSIVATAVFFKFQVQKHFRQDAELYSETLSWILLPVLNRLLPIHEERSALPSAGRFRESSSTSLWVVAACLATYSFYQAEKGIVALSPILTPLLAFLEHRILTEDFVAKTHSHGFTKIPNQLWYTLLVAVLAASAIISIDARGSVLSITGTIALFFTLIPFLPVSRDLPFLPHLFRLQDVAYSLSWRTTICLATTIGGQALLLGSARTNYVRVVTLGVAKAIAWFFTLRTCEQFSCYVASIIFTFSLVSTQTSSTQTSGPRAFLCLIASLLSLAQIIKRLSPVGSRRNWLWLAASLPLLPYVANHLAIWRLHQASIHSFNGYIRHPVERLFQDAQVRYEDLTSRQSRDYQAASVEYQHRFGMNPPNGFEDWHRFASLHQSPIIDDFDVIYKSIVPLLAFSGKEIRDNMHHAMMLPNHELWSCEFQAQQLKTICQHPWRTNDRHITLLFTNLTQHIPRTLGNINFLVNHLDEPRIVAHSYARHSGQLRIQNFAHEPAWSALTSNCDSDGAQHVHNVSEKVFDDFGLPFVQSVSSSQSLCEHATYQNLYGLALSPTSLRLIHGPIPVFSTGSLSTLGDIVIPSPAYIEREFVYDGTRDIPWGSKKNNLYWAGSTTGSYAASEDWYQHQRQRFVTMAQNLESGRMFSYLRESAGRVLQYRLPFLNTRSFDVFFTRIFQCDKQFCRDQKAYFNTRSWAHKDEAINHKLVFDLDGNGISGRYYKLLASSSVPLKMTLLKEWHDDRLIPWLHYVPISLGMEELPEIVSYLTSNTNGRRIAEQIAINGRDWFKIAFREVDMSIYVYRLLLELARLQDPQRPAMTPNFNH